MEWIEFDASEEASVLATNLCAVYGCKSVRGFARVCQLPPSRMKETGEAPGEPDGIVLCRHECDRIPDEELAAEELGTGSQGITLTCPKCGMTTIVPGGFASVDLFVCPECGETIEPLPPSFSKTGSRIIHVNQAAGGLTRCNPYRRV